MNKRAFLMMSSSGVASYPFLWSSGWSTDLSDPSLWSMYTTATTPRAYIGSAAQAPGRSYMRIARPLL